MRSAKILWNFYHPDFENSRANRILIDAIRDVPNVTVRDLYSLYKTAPIDVKAEQELLVAHDLIVSQHPFYWYSAPSLFKEWLDRVFDYGFAYPPGLGDALNGKLWLSVVTVGSLAWSYQSGGYNNFTVSELLRPFQQTAYFCGMKWLAPFAVYGALPLKASTFVEVASDDTIRKNAQELRAFIEKFDLDEHHRLEPVVPPHFLKK